MTRDGRRSRILAGEDGLAPAFRGPVNIEAEGNDSARIAEEAFQRGLAQGRSEAAADFEHQSRQLSRHLADSLKQLGEIEERIATEWKATVTELALAAASRIVRERIEADDPVAARALAEALDVLPAGGPIRARVHPDDLSSIGQDLEAAIESKKLELIGDAAISRGGCVVEGELGAVDATLETADAAIREAAAGEGGA